MKPEPFTIYRKDMERNSVLHAASNHPKHLKDNIPVGQFFRLCSDLNDFHSKKNIIASQFKERGYASNSIQKDLQCAITTSRSDLPSNTQKTKNQSRACCSTEYIIVL